MVSSCLLHQAYSASYITMPCSSISWSSWKLRDRPCEIASSPGACGARSSRLVSAPRTMMRELVERRVARGGISRGRRRSCSARRRARTRRRQRRRAIAVFSSRDLLHFRRRHVEELGPRIDEAAHQPWAGDAVDLRPLARDPARRGVFRFCRELAAFLAPMLDAALEILSRRAPCAAFWLTSWPCTQYTTTLRSARQGLRPIRDFCGVASQGAADQIAGFEKTLVAPHVDDERRRAAAKGLPEFGCTDARVHALSFESVPQSLDARRLGLPGGCDPDLWTRRV